MYSPFGIVRFFPDTANRTIQIVASGDIDSNSVTKDSVLLSDEQNDRIADYTLRVDGSVIFLTLVDWPRPNLPYRLVIQKGVTSVVGEPLAINFSRSVIFESQIISTVSILTPSNYEKVNELNVSWEEKNAAVGSYRLQVAKENVFATPEIDTLISGRNSITLITPTTGQHYLRMRVETADQYGAWSDISSFLIAEPVQPDAPVDTTLEDSPTVVINDEPLDAPSVVTEMIPELMPENGETPLTFIFQFPADLDPTAITKVTVKRRLV